MRRLRKGDPVNIHSHDQPGMFHAFDSSLLQMFADPACDCWAKYDYLFSYFVTGLTLFSGNVPSQPRYPGARSFNGAVCDRMEGFTRMLPVLCSRLASGRERILELLTGGKVNLEDLIVRGLTMGTDSKSAGFWETIGHRDQRIIEAADVALSLWMVRGTLWKQIGKAEQRQIIDWLAGVNGREVWDSNWHLFPTLVNEVIGALGFESQAEQSRAHYQRLKSFYRGDGWFNDGQPRSGVYHRGRVDYYNAWAIHYALFWLNRINPRFDPEFISGSLQEFLKSYVYLISPKGFPILGRSVCYRMAASVPLIAGHIQNSSWVDAGVAKRAFDSLWQHFISNGAVAGGNVTQGYHQADLRFLDNYSGPASCLWSLRSLVLAFSLPADSPFWMAPMGRLPVEMGDYQITIPSLGWIVTGNKETQEIVIHTGNPEKPERRISNYTAARRLAEFFLGRPVRPQNHSVKYDLPRYRSLQPFCGNVRQ